MFDIPELQAYFTLNQLLLICDLINEQLRYVAQPIETMKEMSGSSVYETQVKTKRLSLSLLHLEPVVVTHQKASQAESGEIR